MSENSEKRMADRPLFVAHRADGHRLREQLAVLALADNLAAPGARAFHGGAHLGTEIGVVHAGAQQVRRLAQRFGGAVAGDAGKGAVDGDDALFGVGDQHALVAVLDDAGMQLGFLLQRQAFHQRRDQYAHAGRLAGRVAFQRDRQPDAYHFAGLLAPLHVGHRTVGIEHHFRDVAVLVIVVVQEQHVLAQRLAGAVTEQALGAFVPGRQVAGMVEHELRAGRLVLRLLHALQRRLQLGQGGGQGLALLAARQLAQCQALGDACLIHARPHRQ
jgi:hypothetical protein